MIINSGYSEGGASLKKKRLKLWMPRRISPQSDINLNLSRLRNRASDLAINTTIGSALIKTISLYTIGDGLRVVPRIDARLLNISRENAKEYERQIKAEWDLYSESLDVDYYRRNNFKDLQQIAFESSLIDGDSFVLFKREKPISAGNPYTLRLQVLEGNRISNPDGSPEVTGQTITVKNGNRIIDGVEIDAVGRLIAYWISSGVPYDLTETQVVKWDRVEIYGKRTGQRNILQICRDERSGMTRGIPILSPVIETIKQISRYVEAELDSAITRSYYSLFFTQSNDGHQMDLNNLQENEGIDPNGIELSSGTVVALPAGIDVKAINSSQQSTFPAFVIELTKEVGAAIGVPYEVLMHSFNSSYSASRAALLQAWNNFRKFRACFIRDFCEPIYERFIDEAVLNGRLKLPGYLEDGVKRRAWNRCECYGVQMSILDPKKEIEASKMKLELGLTTHEKESTELTSTDYEENMEQLQHESELIPATERR